MMMDMINITPADHWHVNIVIVSYCTSFNYELKTVWKCSMAVNSWSCYHIVQPLVMSIPDQLCSSTQPYQYGEGVFILSLFLGDWS